MPAEKPILVRPVGLGDVVTGNAQSGNSIYHLERYTSAGLTWRSEGSGNLWARGVFSEAKAIDFCAVLAANALPGTTIRLRLGDSQAEVDGTAPYDSGALPFISPTPTPAPEDGYYHSHLELPSIETRQWWRIDIDGHTGDFEASMLVMGQQIRPERCYNRDFEHGFEDLGGREMNAYGVAAISPGKVLPKLNFELGWMTEAEFETNFRPLIRAVGEKEPIYCCLDPEATGYRQAKTYFGFLERSPFARGIRKPKTYSMEFSILSLI